MIAFAFSAHLHGRRHKKTVASIRARARRKQFQEENKRKEQSSEQPKEKPTQQM